MSKDIEEDGARIPKLQAALKRPEEQLRDTCRDYENLQERYQGSIQKLSSALLEIEKLETQLQKMTEMALFLYGKEHDLNKELQSQEQELSTKNQRIAQFARDIVRLNDDRPDAIRDDFYYQTKLANLFRSVDQWVYIHYGKAEITDTVISSLEEDLLTVFQSLAGDGWVKFLQRDHISLLQAFCILFVVCPILSESLLGVDHPCVAVVKPAIEASIGDCEWSSTYH